MSRISIIGAGIDELKQLTPEARQIVDKANIIFYSSFNASTESVDGTGRWYNLDEIGYRQGAFRPAMYEAMAEKVVLASVVHERIALLQPGSALLLDTVTQRCLDLAKRMGVETEVIPGVSSVETVLSEVRADTVAGLQIISAQSALLRKTVLNPEMTCIILQPGYYDTLYWKGLHHPQEVNYAELVSYLVQNFGSNRVAFLVLSKSKFGQPSIQSIDLGSLQEFSSKISAYHTLVVPGADPGVRNKEFWDRIN